MLTKQRAGGGEGTRAWLNALSDLDTAEFGAKRMVAGIPTGSDLDLDGVLPVQSVDPSRWTWLGPRSVAGRTRALVVDSDRPDRIWAASPSGGVWLTDDAGVSWRPVDDFMANLSVSTLVMRPGHSDELSGRLKIEAVRFSAIDR